MQTLIRWQAKRPILVFVLLLELLWRLLLLARLLLVLMELCVLQLLATPVLLLLWS
jgi:hypothetical protein